MPEVTTISRETLEHRVEQQGIDNESRDRGTALVNVLPPEAFEKEHIPGSINIPQGREDEFEKRFDKSKEIVVYCASHDCSASPKAAEELLRRGFVAVKDYDAGMSDWRGAGNEVATGAQ